EERAEQIVAYGFGADPGDGGIAREIGRPVESEGQELDREEAEPCADPYAFADDRARAVVADEETAVGPGGLVVHPAAHAGDVAVLADHVRDLGAAVEFDVAGREGGIEEDRPDECGVDGERTALGRAEVVGPQGEEGVAAAPHLDLPDRQRRGRRQEVARADFDEGTERRLLEDLGAGDARRRGLALEDADAVAAAAGENGTADPAADDQRVRAHAAIMMVVMRPARRRTARRGSGGSGPRPRGVAGDAARPGRRSRRRPGAGTRGCARAPGAGR